MDLHRGLLVAKGWETIARLALRTPDLEYLTLCERQADGAELQIARVEPFTPEGRELLLDFVDPTLAEARLVEGDDWTPLDGWSGNWNGEGQSAEPEDEEDLDEDDDLDDDEDGSDEEYDEQDDLRAGDRGRRDAERKQRVLERQRGRTLSRDELLTAGLQYMLDAAVNNAMPGNTSTFRLKAYAPKGLSRWSRTFHLTTRGLNDLAGPVVPMAAGAPVVAAPPVGRFPELARDEVPDTASGDVLRMLHDGYQRLFQMTFVVTTNLMTHQTAALGQSAQHGERLSRSLQAMYGRHHDLVEAVLSNRRDEALHKDETVESERRVQVIDRTVERLSGLVEAYITYKAALDVGVPAEAAAGLAAKKSPATVANLGGLQKLAPLLKVLDQDPSFQELLADPQTIAMLENPQVRGHLSSMFSQMRAAYHAQPAEADPSPAATSAASES